MADDQFSIKELLFKAGEAEERKDNTSAIELYNAVIKTDSLNAYAYDRLMKIFRGQKEYKKELVIINSGIRAYQDFYKKSRPKSRQIKDISEKLNKSFGLIDKKGNNLYDPEPIAGWKKRKQTVEKKLK